MRLPFPRILWPLLLLLALTGPGGAAPHLLLDGDCLLNDPALDIPQARRALAAYETAWLSGENERVPLLERLARACFIMGDLSDKNRGRFYFEKGRIYAELLIKEQPQGPAGHYWLALNLCGVADCCGLLVGRELLPRILEEFEAAAKFDPAYDQGGAHRFMGRIYYEAPAWPMSVGDLQKAVEHLARAVQLAPDNSSNHLYLGETLMRLGNSAQARLELQKALEAPSHALHPRGKAEDQQEARRLLAKLGDGQAPAPGKDEMFSWGGLKTEY